MKSLLLRLAALGLVCGMLIGGPTVAQAQVDEQQAFAYGVEACIYGYPLVTLELTRRIMTNTAVTQGTHAPMGQFVRMREYPDASFRGVTAPNADTLYSTAWLDLSREPCVLSLPDMGDRYVLMPMLDGWTNVFEVPGTRTTGNFSQPARRPEGQPGRVARHRHPERIAGQGSSIQLAAGSPGRVCVDDAAVLAEGYAPFDH